ncbi:putative splicing factor 3a subunit 3 [Myriangium duriaei CBS 260.36]|uniref:Splicing factor 3a subunit 3 n=1 Tax=Myriangium duriaei CBS 260.36 TaxID=1168546 RepID=A0A9P4J1Q1_9PEZI|nr:putative splicing factor 3a subunit 3 [Myriangium duriaei CBS 260.36]
MVLEDLRLIHEDNERLEQAIAERFLEDHTSIRHRLGRDHQIASFLERTRTNSLRAKEIYTDTANERLKEIQAIATGENFTEFNKRLEDIRAFHKRYPGQPTDNLERAYKRRAVGDYAPFAPEVDLQFTGEEGYGRYFDLQQLHEEYVNLPGLKRRLNYLQYLDAFDDFGSFPRAEKMKEQYFTYLNGLVRYLESFMRKVKPLENLDKLFGAFDKEFEEAWEQDKVPGWQKDVANGATSNGPATQGTGEGIWCDDCEKEFSNENVYKGHLNGKKHLRNAQAKKARGEEAGANGANGLAKKDPALQRLKEKAVAEREFRIKKLAGAMKTERSDTKTEVERKQAQTPKEREQEREAKLNEELNGTGGGGAAEEEGDDEDIKANPLHLPLAWDGKPIPFWLYKLHGLGVEYPCEICGNYVYMGRRAYEKHFSEARHLYGLKCLGITNSSMFREITGIAEAVDLWDKLQKDKKVETTKENDVIQMEDSQGNVMPEKVYNDLLKAGLL